MKSIHYVTLCLGLWLVTEKLDAQAGPTAQDSLVNPYEIQFTSQAEKDAYIAYLSDSSSINLLKLMILSGNSISQDALEDYLSQVKQFVQTIDLSELDKMKEKKKVKYIYDDVHKVFFKKYEEKVIFQDIFTKGYYNCATASSLFACIFDLLRIPYNGKETPSHVFLVAYPASSNILVETTTPGTGSVSFSDKTISDYINYLVRSKIITAEDTRNQSVNELFN